MDTILIIGSGARENAILETIKKSPKVGKIFISPGNGGTSEYNGYFNFMIFHLNFFSYIYF